MGQRRDGTDEGLDRVPGYSHLNSKCRSHRRVEKHWVKLNTPSRDKSFSLRLENQRGVVDEVTQNSVTPALWSEHRAGEGCPSLYQTMEHSEPQSYSRVSLPTPHCTDGETEAQRAARSCPRLRDRLVTELRLELSGSLYL